MAADKEIIQLPDTNILNSSYLAIQRSGASVTNRVSVDVFLAYLSAQVQPGVTRGGQLAPPNTLGKNGDSYFRSNGEVYYKLAGAWQLVVTLQTGSVTAPPITTNIPAGTSLGYDGSGYSFSIPFDPSIYGAKPRIEIYLASGRTFGWVDRGIDGGNVNLYLPNDGADAPVTIDDYQVTISV